MNELEEIMNGKHEIKHLKIDNDTLSFNRDELLSILKEDK